MRDFPIAELLDDSICTIWLERHLHPRGLVGPHCGHSERRVFRAQKQVPAYRCRACDGYYTLRQLKNSGPRAGDPLEQGGMSARAEIRHHSSSHQKPDPFLRRSHHEPNKTAVVSGAHRPL